MSFDEKIMVFKRIANPNLAFLLLFLCSNFLFADPEISVNPDSFFSNLVNDEIRTQKIILVK